MTSDARRVLEHATTVAVVGASNDPLKAAHYVPADLQEAGYRIIPVNPTASEVLGERCRASLADVGEPIDLVVVFRPSPEAADVTRQAVDAGARGVWLQQGIVSAQARQLAEAAGIDFVEDRCAMVDRRRWGITRPAATG